MRLIQIGRFDRNAVVLVVFLVAFSFATFSDAQTSSHKKKKRHKPAVITRIPDPPMTDPIIVSRASDYQNQNPPVAPADEVPTIAIETERDRQLANLASRIKQLESGMKNGYDEKQKRLLLNLDILTRAEQRSESLRKQRFELIEKENQIQSRLDQISIDIRPDTIERAVAIAGSLRPEELREAKRKSLEAESRNLQQLLTQVQATRAALDDSVNKSDEIVQKLRAKLEDDIDKTLDDKPDQ